MDRKHHKKNLQAIVFTNPVIQYMNLSGNRHQNKQKNYQDDWHQTIATSRQTAWTTNHAPTNIEDTT